MRAGISRGDTFTVLIFMFEELETEPGKNHDFIKNSAIVHHRPLELCIPFDEWFDLSPEFRTTINGNCEYSYSENDRIVRYVELERKVPDSAVYN